MTTDKLFRQYTWDGRPVRVYAYDREAQSTELRLEGTVKNVEWAEDEFTILFNDRLSELEVPFQPARFLGTAVGATGIEGASELTGQIKPSVFGTVLNIPAPLLNAATLVHGVNFDIDGFDFTLANDQRAVNKNPTGEFPVQVVALDRTHAAVIYNHDDSGDGLFIELLTVDRGTSETTPQGLELSLDVGPAVWAHAIKLDQDTVLVVWEDDAGNVEAIAAVLDRIASPWVWRKGTAATVGLNNETPSVGPVARPRVALFDNYDETAAEIASARVVFINSSGVAYRDITVTRDLTAQVANVTTPDTFGSVITVATSDVTTVDIATLITQDNAGTNGARFGIVYGHGTSGTGFLEVGLLTQSGTWRTYVSEIASSDRADHARIVAVYDPDTYTGTDFFHTFVAFRRQSDAALVVRAFWMDDGIGGTTGGNYDQELVFAGSWGHPEIVRLTDERAAIMVGSHTTGEKIHLGAVWSNGYSIKGQTPEPIGQANYHHGSVDVLTTDEHIGLIIGMTEHPVPSTVRAITAWGTPTAQPQPVAAFDAVYDSGLGLTFGADFKTIAALEGSSPSGGTFNTCLNSGAFILGASPTGSITADVTENDDDARRRQGNAARIVERILTNPHRVGAAAGRAVGNLSRVPVKASAGANPQLSPGSFNTLEAANDAILGIFIFGEFTVLEVCQLVLNSVGAGLSADRSGFFVVPRFAAAGAASASFTTQVIIGGSFRRLVSNDPGSGIPAHLMSVGFQRNYTVQTADQLVGAVPDSESATSHGRTFLAREFRFADQLDPSVLQRHKLSPAQVVAALFADEADAEVEAERLATLYCRDIGPWEIAVQRDEAKGVDIGHTIEVTHPRFGFDTGRKGVVTGITELFGVNETVLEFWTT